MENPNDNKNAVIDDDKPNANAFLSEKDNKKINEATVLNDNSTDDVPSANAQNRDTGSQKKLKTLAIFVGALLVAIAGIVMAGSRYSDNKAKRKAQEAESIAQNQKKIADGSVDIASDQAQIERSKMYDIPPPVDATTDMTASNPPITPSEPVVEPYVPPPNPIPNSQYDNTVAYRDYVPPAPMPMPAYEPSPIPLETAPAQHTPTQNQVVPPADVLVDVYGVKTTTVSTQSNAQTKNSIEMAQRRGNTDLLLIKGTAIPCVLKTKIDSTYQGFTVCQVSRDVYSANGKALLIERGSSVFGEQNVEIKQGQARVAIIWQKIETPKGISVNVDSPATGQLGEMGVGARVNTHFFKRFGNAILLSLIQDAIAHSTTHLEKTKETSDTTITNTTKTTQSMAEKALENSINIPPTAIVHQGTLINILVNRDVDFSSVYGVERVY